ncbi:MAG: serine/threonine protein kinase [bacterium]|nr:serine/threonine protein kinase [bacterium]
MTESTPEPQRPDRAALRARLAADLAAGRTVALSNTEMGDAELREELPRLLEELGQVRDQPAEPAGLRIPGYTVLGEIGSGGMSTVYLARHEQLGRHDALKILHAGGHDDSRGRERLLREARAMATLQHPNIVTVYDIVEAGDLIAIAMEWVDGLSLAGLLRALPQQPTQNDMATLRAALGTNPGAETAALETTVVRTFVRLVHDTALAVACAHENKLLHLDIKPSNVLVRRDGTALLTDFGVVRELDLDHTHTQSFAGTPIYAAPEQLRRDDEHFGPATDVYGLGMTLYELLARTQPLQREGLAEMLRRVEAGRLPRLSTLAEVATDLENIVHKAIAVEPGNRYANANEFAADLRAFLDGRPVSAKPLPALQRVRRWARAEPWQAALVAVLLIGVPSLTWLGTTLWSEMPRIRASQRRELREKTAADAQYSFQSFLVTESTSQVNLKRLRDALALDREDPMVTACLLTVLGQDHMTDARAEIAMLPDHLRNTRGAELLDLRLAAGQPFYATADVAELAESDDLFDLLLVVLDRVLCNRDSLVEEDLESVEHAVDKLTAGFREANPLAHGLGAWIAAQLEDLDQLRVADFALQSIWPNSESACLWRMLAAEVINLEAAIRIGREFLANQPGNYPVTVRVVAMLFEVERFAPALELLDAARPTNERAGRHRALMRTKALVGLGQNDEARQLFESLPTPAASLLGPWLLQLELIDPEAAHTRYEELLATSGLSAAMFQQTFGFAFRRKDRELAIAALTKACQQHPHRARFRWEVAPFLYKDGRTLEAARLVRDLRVPRARVDEQGHAKAIGLVALGEFDELATLCERWSQHCHQNAQRVSFFRGIACSRRGEFERAKTAFEEHIAAARQNRTRTNAEAWFELAWLAVHPDRDAASRDPEVATRLLEQPLARAALRRKPNAWLTIVAAEVRFQNGDPVGARELLDTAESQLDLPSLTAPTDLEQRIAAARARYR